MDYTRGSILYQRTLCQMFLKHVSICVNFIYFKVLKSRPQIMSIGTMVGPSYMSMFIRLGPDIEQVLYYNYHL